MSTRPSSQDLTAKATKEVPMSLQRIAAASAKPDRYWVGPEDAKKLKLTEDERKAYEIAHQIMIRLCIEAPTKHSSGHPGGSLSAFTFTYLVNAMRDPMHDQTMRMSAGHLSLLAYNMEWLFGRDGGDERLASPQAIIDTFRTISGLPGHAEAGVGDIPFGAGPLGKGVSNTLGVAFARKLLKKQGKADVLLADGDSQEGQVMEAFRLAGHLKTDNLIVHGDWNDIQLSGLPTKTMSTDLASIAHAAGWAVIEVQDGNDYAQVKAALLKADELCGKGAPIFICYYTTMGYGVPLMEEGSNTGKKNFHGTPLSKDDAKAALDSLKLPPMEELEKAYMPWRQKHREAFAKARLKRASSRLRFSLPKDYKRAITTEPGGSRKDFGAVHLKALMAGDPRIIVLHADLADSGGFGAVEKVFPDRVINVGVAEANMYMMAAGMRQEGFLPVTYTFAAFGTNEARANARLIDINGSHVPLGVLHDCTHAGLSVGEDGETHQDRNYANIPFDQTEVWVGADCNQAGAMAERGMEIIAGGRESVYVFFPRTNHPQLSDKDGKPFYGPSYIFDGRANIVRGFGDQRDEATIISCGITLHEAVKAADMLAADNRHVRVLNMACIRPMDSAAVLQAALETQHLIVVEDHNTEGGLATQVADLVADLALPCVVRRLGTRHYFPSGKAEDLNVLAGLDAENIVNVTEDQFAYRLAGGEEALVAFLYGLGERLPHTRFAVRAMQYVERLRTDKEYMQMLRTIWKSRAFNAKQLPSGKDLIEMLERIIVPDGLNPITGTEYSHQHDLGIVP